MAPLAATLAAVAAALHDARDPWWIIGSAAVWLHGVRTTVDDVDVLASARDARRLIDGWPGEIAYGTGSARFRSQPFARLGGAAMPVEVMADLHVCVDGVWRPVCPVTRVASGWDDGSLIGSAGSSSAFDASRSGSFRDDSAGGAGSRQPVRDNVFVPAREELVAILRLFGRVKDEDRARRLLGRDPS